MITEASLQDIAARCDEHFNSLKPLDIQDCQSVFEFLETELINDILIPNVSFDALMGGFRKTIEVTINKTAFIESELNAINKLLGPGLTAWHKQTPVNHYRAYNEIRGLILTGKDEFEVFTHYYMKHLNKGGATYKLVSVIYCFGLIKYQLFLEGDLSKDEQQLKSVEGKQRPIKLPKKTIALFCTLMDKTNQLPKGKNETQKAYCKRVCNQFSLPYTDMVRQHYGLEGNLAVIENMQQLIFPIVSDDIRNGLTEYLNKKPPTEQRMYV